jgi:hypothetical protein
MAAALTLLVEIFLLCAMGVGKLETINCFSYVGITMVCMMILQKEGKP